MKRLINYKDAYQNLKHWLINKGYKVEEVADCRTRDYVGMNDLAAKEMGAKKLQSKTLQVDAWLDWKAKYHTLKHEYVERVKMSKGKRYWDAHQEALEREKYGR